MSTKKDYILKKYNELNISFTDENINYFNPNIYPQNDDTIQVCSECKLDYDTFKQSKIYEDMNVIVKHSDGCLWNEYFIDKIKIICPTAKIIRNKLNK